MWVLGIEPRSSARGNTAELSHPLQPNTGLSVRGIGVLIVRPLEVSL